METPLQAAWKQASIDSVRQVLAGLLGKAVPLGAPHADPRAYGLRGDGGGESAAQPQWGKAGSPPASHLPSSSTGFSHS